MARVSGMDKLDKSVVELFEYHLALWQEGAKGPSTWVVAKDDGYYAVYGVKYSVSGGLVRTYSQDNLLKETKRDSLPVVVRLCRGIIEQQVQDLLVSNSLSEEVREELLSEDFKKEIEHTILFDRAVLTDDNSVDVSVGQVIVL